MHTTLRMITVVFLLLVAMAGCDFKRGEHATSDDGVQGTVAVIGLSAIFKEFGRDEQIKAALEQHGALLKKQLDDLKAKYEQDLAQQKEKIGATPTQEQKQYLDDSERRAALHLNQEKQKANLSLNKYRTQLIRDFRNKIKPVASKVAGERGLSIIIMKNEDLVFDYETSVDITDTVIERMRAESPPSRAIIRP